MTKRQPIRHAIVGVGAGVFNMHKAGLALETTEVVGATDLDGVKGQERAGELDCPFFTDYEAMLAETQPDVVVILAPHIVHASLALTAFQAGCHVLVEKPIAVQISEADKMVQAAEKAGKLLAVSFQQRARPEITAAKQIIESGKLGQIQHVDIRMHWTRPAMYYSSAPWRGTWNGEGGGVLMNQGIHELDLLVYLFGMPARLIAWARTIAHSIEVEDTFQAMCEWSDGRLGSVHISTAEAGQSQRIEVTGSQGHLTIFDRKMELKRAELDIRDYIKTADKPFAPLNMIAEMVDIPEVVSGHEAIYRNFHEAIYDGVPLIADGRSAAMSLELSNAINYSSRMNQPVEFPLERDAYADLLAKLRADVRA